ARMWHPTKNGSLLPTDFTPGSRKKVWWQCEKDKSHQWEAAILTVKRLGFCPYCREINASLRSLQVQNPELAKQWHPHKNGDLTPGQVTPHCNTKVWWVCEEGHEYQAMVANRNRAKPRGCTTCSANKRRHKRKQTKRKK
ncbi:MAG: zinc-ribbon domain-containing protein, partial [bacterium]|nr:zinc-ribbon domain-containing protein [bacterium]